MSPSEIDSHREVSAIETRTIEYEHDGVTLRGFLAYDDAVCDRRPGVLVFPEWWGLNEYAKTRAKKLAQLGYVALAADVYGDGKVIDINHSESATTMAATLRANTKMWRERAVAALEQLTGLPNVDASKIAAIGYCLDSALQLAYTGADLKAVATFHSNLPTPTDAEALAIKAQMLVCVGEADKYIPAQAIEDFRAALHGAAVKFEIISYEGVVHSFTSPEADRVGNPALKYDKHADQDSWIRLQDLFNATLGQPWQVAR